MNFEFSFKVHVTITYLRSCQNFACYVKNKIFYQPLPVASKKALLFQNSTRAITEEKPQRE